MTRREALALITKSAAGYPLLRSGLYARALRYGDRLTPSERAELLERRAKECFFIDQYEEGIANLEEALQCRRQVGDRLREGEVMHRLSEFMWCPGRTAESERAAREAVALEPRNAVVNNTLGWVLLRARKGREAIAPLALAVRLDPNEVQPHYNLALAYHGVADEQRARQQAAIVKRLDPHSAQELEAALRQ